MAALLPISSAMSSRAVAALIPRIPRRRCADPESPYSATAFAGSTPTTSYNGNKRNNPPPMTWNAALRHPSILRAELVVLPEIGPIPYDRPISHRAWRASTHLARLRSAIRKTGQDGLCQSRFRCRHGAQRRPDTRSRSSPPITVSRRRSTARRVIGVIASAECSPLTIWFGRRSNAEPRC